MRPVPSASAQSPSGLSCEADAEATGLQGLRDPPLCVQTTAQPAARTGHGNECTVPQPVATQSAQRRHGKSPHVAHVGSGDGAALAAAMSEGEKLRTRPSSPRPAPRPAMSWEGIPCWIAVDDVRARGRAGSQNARAHAPPRRGCGEQRRCKSPRTASVGFLRKRQRQRADECSRTHTSLHDRSRSLGGGRKSRDRHQFRNRRWPYSSVLTRGIGASPGFSATSPRPQPARAAGGETVGR